MTPLNMVGQLLGGTLGRVNDRLFLLAIGACRA